MAILHLQPSEIARMEWDEMAWYHSHALTFYEVDRQHLAASVAGCFAGVGGDG